MIPCIILESGHHAWPHLMAIWVTAIKSGVLYFNYSADSTWRCWRSNSLDLFAPTCCKRCARFLIKFPKVSWKDGPFHRWCCGFAIFMLHPPRAWGSVELCSENILKFVERLLFLASMTVVHRVFFSNTKQWIQWIHFHPLRICSIINRWNLLATFQRWLGFCS